MSDKLSDKHMMMKLRKPVKVNTHDGVKDSADAISIGSRFHNARRLTQYEDCNSGCDLNDGTTQPTYVGNVRQISNADSCGKKRSAFFTFDF